MPDVLFEGFHGPEKGRALRSVGRVLIGDFRTLYNEVSTELG